MPTKPEKREPLRTTKIREGALKRANIAASLTDQFVGDFISTAADKASEPIIKKAGLKLNSDLPQLSRVA